MNDILLAEFRDADALLRAARQGKRAGFGLIDAFSPYPIEGLAQTLGETSTRIRVAMFIGGIGAAAVCYLLEWWTAVIDYPINSGGRPNNSWLTFVMFPFAFGILSAAVTGLAALFFRTGLPRLHFPLFAIERFARATQDAFLLVVDAPALEQERQRARDFLRAMDAVAIWEIDR